MNIRKLLRVAAGRARAAIFRIQGASLGAKVTLGSSFACDAPARLCMGARTTTEADVWIKFDSATGRVRIGNFCFLGRSTEIDCVESVTIGDRTLVGPNVFMTDHNHDLHGVGPIAEQGCVSSPVQIGNDVWIGTGAVILPGVSIGDGAVVGAGAVVTKSVPPLEVWGGVPARCIKVRRAE